MMLYVVSPIAAFTAAPSNNVGAEADPTELVVFID